MACCSFDNDKLFKIAASVTRCKKNKKLLSLELDIVAHLYFISGLVVSLSLGVGSKIGAQIVLLNVL